MLPPDVGVLKCFGAGGLGGRIVTLEIGGRWDRCRASRYDGDRGDAEGRRCCGAASQLPTLGFVGGTVPGRLVFAGEGIGPASL